MKSATIVFTGQQKCEVVEEQVSNPSPDDVLVHTVVSLTSTGTESFCYRGVFDTGTGWSNWVNYPFYPGYSAVGEITEVGSNVSSLKVGDRVYTGANHKEYHLTRPENVVRLPDNVSCEAAAWSTLATITQTVVRRAEHAMGDTAVVIGLGPLGQLVTQYLRTIGLGDILVIDTIPQCLATATRFGATAAFNGLAADAGDFVSEQTEGRLADVVYDVTGHWQVFPTALPLARDFGRLILLGDSPEPSKQRLTQDILTRQVAVVGTHNTRLQPEYAYWTRNRQIELFYKYIERRIFHVEDLITHRYQPDQAPEVYEQFLRDRSQTLGVLFDWR